MIEALDKSKLRLTTRMLDRPIYGRALLDTGDFKGAIDDSRRSIEIGLSNKDLPCDGRCTQPD